MPMVWCEPLLFSAKFYSKLLSQTLNTFIVHIHYFFLPFPVRKVSSHYILL